MRRILVVGMLLLGSGLEAAGQPSTTRQLSRSDAERWATRLERFVGAHLWSVAAERDKIVLQRKEPVAFVDWPANQAAGEALDSVPAGTRRVRFVLQFAPKLSLVEYERLAAINDASDKEEDRLRRAVNLSYKFDDFIATTAEEKQRLLRFREAVAKLPRHHLPPYYTPDHSVYLYQSWPLEWSPADKTIEAELQTIENDLVRYLGMYDARAALGGGFVVEALEPGK
jgi:hypothetical protein